MDFQLAQTLEASARPYSVAQLSKQWRPRYMSPGLKPVYAALVCILLQVPGLH